MAAKWKHGWIPLNAEATAEKSKSLHGTGGFSMNIHGKKPEHGYMVSYSNDLGGNEKAVPGLASDKQITEHGKSALDLLQNPENFHGGWHDTDSNQTYLDVSKNIQSRRDAAVMAVKHKQISVYDVDNDDVVNTSDLQKEFGLSRTIIAPSADHDLAVKESGKAYWKQILPMSEIRYTDKAGKRQSLNFDQKYLTDLATAFDEGALDSTPFLLADADNRHTMDPERQRGKVVAVQVRSDGEKPGLYGKIVFPTKEDASAIMRNPDLGVSARIREGIETADGRSFPAGIIHVLGTLDPQVTGMAPWEPVDLSEFNDNVLDLSQEQFSEGKSKMGTRVGRETTKEFDFSSVTVEDIDKMTEEELEAFLAEVAPDLAATLADEEDEDEDESDEDESDEESDEDDDDREPELSKNAVRDIELANASAAAANDRANKALRRQAEAEWRETRAEYLSAGVPPFMLDLAAPIMQRPDEMVVDLSNTDESDLNVSEIIKGFLDGAKGLVDLSVEAGHSAVFTNDDKDPDADLLKSWDSQFPTV